MATSAFNLGGVSRIKTLTLLGESNIGDNGIISVTAPKTGTYLAVERFGPIDSYYPGKEKLEIDSGTLLFSDCMQLVAYNVNNYCQIYLVSASAGEKITLRNAGWTVKSNQLTVRIYSFN